jgi:hypothetical protein
MLLFSKYSAVSREKGMDEKNDLERDIKRQRLIIAKLRAEKETLIKDLVFWENWSGLPDADIESFQLQFIWLNTMSNSQK